MHADVHVQNIEESDDNGAPVTLNKTRPSATSTSSLHQHQNQPLYQAVKMNKDGNDVAVKYRSRDHGD